MTTFMDLFGLRPRYDLEDLVLHGNHLFCVGVPYDSHPQFRKYVFAGAVAHHLQLRSIDRALKGYIIEREWESLPYTDPRLELIRQMTALVKKEVVAATDSAISTPTDSDKAGFIAATVALARLPATFRIAVFALRLSCPLEAAALCRMILEQLAWIYAVYEMPGNEWAKVEPSRCIKKLKEFYPAAGEVYGLLSTSAHIHPSTQGTFVLFEEGKIRVEYGNMTASLWETLLLLEVCDLHLLLSELIYAEFKGNTKLLKRGPSGKLVAKLGRPMRKVIKRFIKSARVCEKKIKAGKARA